MAMLLIPIQLLGGLVILFNSSTGGFVDFSEQETIMQQINKIIEMENTFRFILLPGFVIYNPTLAYYH